MLGADVERLAVVLADPCAADDRARRFDQPLDPVAEADLEPVAVSGALRARP